VPDLRRLQRLRAAYELMSSACVAWGRSSKETWRSPDEASVKVLLATLGPLPKTVGRDRWTAAVPRSAPVGPLPLETDPPWSERGR